MHTEHPTGYVAYHDWAEKKAKTHTQMVCPACGLWAIWVANKESKMIPAILHHLEEAIKEAKALPKTRESSLVITKLEEALHWYRAIPSAQ